MLIRKYLMYSHVMLGRIWFFVSLVLFFFYFAEKALRCLFQNALTHLSLHLSLDICSICGFEMHVFTVMICCFASFQIPRQPRLPSLSSCFLSSLFPASCFYRLPSPGLLLPSMREGDLDDIKLFMIINQWPHSIHSLPVRKWELER